MLAAPLFPMHILQQPTMLKSNYNAKLKHRKPQQKMLEAVQEIAIYIHRFHNLDLFQQGWYQIKITMRWEDGISDSVGTPSRVVQYEAPDSCSDNVYGVWRIDDKDHSIYTQPFRIRYARQDILLLLMVSFNLSLAKYEGPSSSAVILKFELLYAPVLENRSDLQGSLDICPTAVHEFRIPPKALLGLHSYCPVHFDAFHAVLVDASVHICLLRSGLHTSSSNRPSGSCKNNVAVEDYDKSKQAMLVKGFLNARDILVKELQKISKAINRAIDVNDFASKHEVKELLSFPTDADSAIDANAVSGQAPSSRQNVSKKPNNISEEVLHSLSTEELLSLFICFGNQVVYLWGVFQKFHRAHKTSILDFLREQWAIDRRAEWSIWMIYSNVEMPHQYISSNVDKSFYLHTRGRARVLKKLTEDPAHAAAMRADLHRRSIAQMRINHSSIQDMQIFGDPSRIPIVTIERVINAPLRTTSGFSYFIHREEKDTDIADSGFGSKAINKLTDGSPGKNARVLKIVVFVHGFQGHHLDLRLIRNQWLLIDPKTEFLMSEVNEEKTSGDFREMGFRLAQEVTSFIRKKMDKATKSGNLKSIKLSFVGHSIGNIILRTALTENVIEPYLRYLYTYVSVSGPHLGYLYSSNSLFNSGLWLLKKLKNTQCIHQLTFTDDPDLKNTFLYKLSKQKTLEKFRNVVLLSSPQDGYVPYHSARIEMCQASSGDKSKKGTIFLEMLNNCMDQIRAPSFDHRVFMRCDVCFDRTLQGKSLNTMIGRAAHIEFLESDAFAKFILWSFPELFN
ncbi:protein FAM135B-like isoform X2 [Ipomoea triloba]|uniref:protein FAM135B-like isoform X2 n=1 Tax=Ipomoea triloba TaxID=35885 RepID=UPI00125E9CDB|nr:protein FAM135B-like isoform X2 [Ipomoea triloba]